MARKNIAGEDPPSRVVLQYKLYSKSSQGCLYEKRTKKLGMKQCAIRNKDSLFFIRFCSQCVTHPSPEYGRTKWCYIVLR